MNVRGQLHADSFADDGGRILITGEDIRVAAGAVLTAAGYTGGGEVLVGGDYLGGGAIPHAKNDHHGSGRDRSTPAPPVTATGGKVILWSDENTEFHGQIAAKGGPQGGDGGFIETSSKEVLSVSGTVDASAPHGHGGEWLLDPNNITINATADANVAGSPDWTTTANSGVLTVASIQGALNAGTSVTVTTGTAGGNCQAGNITVNSAIGKTAGGDASLTLKAHNNITLSNNVDITSTSGKLNVTLWADAVTPNGGAASDDQRHDHHQRRQRGDRRRRRPYRQPRHRHRQLRRGSRQRRYFHRRRQYLDPRQGRSGGTLIITASISIMAPCCRPPRAISPSSAPAGMGRIAILACISWMPARDYRQWMGILPYRHWRRTGTGSNPGD